MPVCERLFALPRARATMPLRMRRRILMVSARVLLAAALLVLLLWSTRRQPPRSARLLPPSDAIFYLDVNILRRAGVFSQLAQVTREAEYEDFVRQTGFQFERDLDEAAFAVHAPPASANSRVANDDVRFSEIFMGRWDEARVRAWLERHSVGRETHRETYGDTVLYSIPHEGRTVRVALLDGHTAAISNTDSPDAIHAMLDRRHENSAQNSLLAGYWKDVPRGSIAWLVANVMPPADAPPTRHYLASSGIAEPSWLRDVAGGSVLVVSLRFLTSLQLRAEAVSDSPERAQQITDNANSWLAIFRALQQSVGVQGTDADVKSALASLHLEQKENRTVLQAEVGIGVLRKRAAAPPK